MKFSKTKLMLKKHNRLCKTKTTAVMGGDSRKKDYQNSGFHQRRGRGEDQQLVG